LNPEPFFYPESRILKNESYTMTSTARFEQMDFQTDSTEMVGRLERSIAPADRPKILIPAGHPRSLQ